MMKDGRGWWWAAGVSRVMVHDAILIGSDVHDFNFG